MLEITIPGREKLVLSHLILDYNGTIATDGALIDGIEPRLQVLAQALQISVVTADTHGTAAQVCKDGNLPVQVLTYPCDNVAPIKARIVREFQESALPDKSCSTGVVAIGNGFNDVQMFETSDLSIAVIGSEGCYGPSLAKADIVVTSILDALDLLIKPMRVRATLRS